MGTTFRVGVRVMQPIPGPYNAYRWAIEWPTAGLNFEGSVAETGPSIGLGNCVDAARPAAIDPAYNEAHSGGCSSGGAGTSYAGKLTEFVMSCASPGLFRVNMIDSRVASTNYTTLTGPDGVINTLGDGIFIECVPPSAVTLALDANITNGSGPCTQIDDVATIAVGQQVQVGVCLLNPDASVPLTAFQYRVTYDDRIIVAPEVANSGSGLDDNPDANEGATTFTSPIFPATLGPVWDCHAEVGAYPVADRDGMPENGTGIAWSGGCASIPFASSTLFQGPLGVITFNAIASGSVSLDLVQVDLTDDNLFQIGSCAPVVDRPASCLGGTIVVTGDVPTSTLPPPTSTPTATSTPPATSPTPIIVDNRRPRRL
jgi:hypothetical protein